MISSLSEKIAFSLLPSICDRNWNNYNTVIKQGGQTKLSTKTSWVASRRRLLSLLPLPKLHCYQRFTKQKQQNHIYIYIYKKAAADSTKLEMLWDFLLVWLCIWNQRSFYIRQKAWPQKKLRWVEACIAWTWLRNKPTCWQQGHARSTTKLTDLGPLMI